MIREGTICGYQVRWSTANAKWETVTEIEYYRAMHNEDTLCHGRLIRMKPVVDEVILTNEDGIIRPDPEAKP